MKSIHIHVSDVLSTKLKALSAEREVSMSHLVKEFIYQGLGSTYSSTIRLREKYEYYPGSGQLFHGGTKTPLIGKRYRPSDRENLVEFEGERWSIGDLVWWYHHGNSPIYGVDYLDGNPKNTRIENLKLRENPHS